MWFLEIQFFKKEWFPIGIFPQCKQKCVFWTFYFSKKSVKSMSISEMCKFVSFNSLSLYMGEGGKNRCLRLYIGYNILLCVMLLRPRSLPARHSPLTLRRPPSQGPQWAEKGNAFDYLLSYYICSIDKHILTNAV